MNETIKLWLEAMVQNELNEVSGELRNFKLMHMGCCADPDCDTTVIQQSINDLLTYQEVLTELKEKINAGEI